MKARRLQARLRQALDGFPAVVLIGPRQAGKTTLARRLDEGSDRSARARIPPEYLDLENPADQSKLEDASSYLRTRPDRLVIIDEVQRAPGLFQILRGVIDERILDGHPTGHFLLLGSAALELLKQSTESLAGRIEILELAPFDVLEVEPGEETPLWIRGGFPRSLLAESEEASVAWRASFIATYLERDIPQLGPRIPAETLRRFWTMLAHRQGAILNLSELARSLAVSGKTVAGYLDLLVDLLLVRRLEPLHANVSKRLVRSPKIYVRDSGLVHTLLRLDRESDVLGHPISGASWEGHIVESLLAASPQRTDPHYYRTAAGAEVDLVLDLPGGKRWIVEIKRGGAPTLTRGFHSAMADLEPDRAFVVYSGRDRYPKGERIEAIGVRELAVELTRLG
jgi:uncharacterized protein